MPITVETTPLEGVLLITPTKHGDRRGFFSEVYNKPALAEHGIRTEFIQDNHAHSATPSTLRGLHFQTPPFAQTKLVRVTRGAVVDVAVDIRRSSPTYGQHIAAELSADNWRQILVPKGFAHGYRTLTPDAEVLYKVDAPYAPDNEGGLRWDDPTLAIDWGLAPGDQPPIVADRDTAWPAFAGFQSPFD
jgi:dTDP-4-dehydrorhamnose 3,5-epimerase